MERPSRLTKSFTPLALMVLLLLSFAPLPASAKQSQNHTILQYVETVYAHSGTFTVNKSTSAGTFTETITVNHKGNAANVQETVVFAASSGSSELLYQGGSQNFSITDKSAPGNPDYIVNVPSHNLVVELNQKDSFVINPDAPLTVSYYVYWPNGGSASTSASPWYTCGNTWSLSSSDPPLTASWNGPYYFWDLCVDYNFFWSGTLTMSDTSGFGYSSSSVSYSGSYNSYHYTWWGEEATVSMGWSYVEIVPYP